MVNEKRLTLSTKLPGHHHIISMEPNEFTEYVKMIRNAQSSLGIKSLNPSDGDLQERKKAFRHLVVTSDLKKGTILSYDDLEGKRPENGLSPEYMDYFIGKELKRDLKYNDSIDWDDI